MKKPARGGARPGAGRPATGRTVVPGQITLSPAAWARLDQLVAERGARSRGELIAALLEGLPGTPASAP